MWIVSVLYTAFAEETVLVYYETEFGSLCHYQSSHKNSLGARNVIFIQYINPIISLPRSEIL